MLSYVEPKPTAEDAFNLAVFEKMCGFSILGKL